MYPAAEKPVFLHIIRQKTANYMYFWNFSRCNEKTPCI